MKEYILSVPATWILYLAIIVSVPIIVNLGSKKRKKVWWIIAWLLLTVVAGFRSNTGQDWTLYENAYSSLVYHGGNFLQAAYNIEITFKLFAWISYKLMGNSLLMFLLYAGLTNYFALAGINRFKDSLNTGWASFVYTGMLYFAQYNLGRQFLAMMIVFFAIKDIVNRHLVKYIFAIALASLFHSTALLALPIYFYGAASREHARFKNLFNIMFYLLPVVALLGINQLISIAGSILGNSKYDSYTTSGSVGFGLGIILQAVMLTLVIVCYRKRRCNLQCNEALLTVSMRLYVLACVFFLLQYMMTSFGGRIYLYFIPVEMILLGASLGDVKLLIGSSKIRANIYQLMLLLVIVVVAVHGIATNSQVHVPYGFRVL